MPNPPMRRPRRPALAAILTLSLLVATLAAPAHASGHDRPEPITLVGDAALLDEALARGWPGSGTPEDPIVIANLRYVHPEDHAVSLHDTRLHVRIAGGFFELGQGTTSLRPAAIRLVNVSDVTVTGITVYDTHHGLVVERSSSVRLEASTFVDARVSLDRVENSSIVGIRVHGFWLNLLASPDIVVRDSSFAGRAFGSLTVQSPGALVENNSFAFVHVGIFVHAAHGARLVGNVVQFASTAGIFLHQSADVELAANRLRGDGSGYGVLIANAPSARLEDNEISRFDRGVRLQEAAGAVLAGNTVKENAVGVLVESGEVTLDRTAFSRNAVGVRIESSTGEPARGVTLRENRFEEEGVAIRIERAHEIHLVNNVVKASDTGLFARFGGASELVGNRFEGNRIGLVFELFHDNVVYDNVFANRVNAEVHRSDRNAWNVEPRPGVNAIGGLMIGGNHWSDHVGVDADGDGLADTPYGVPDDRASRLSITGYPASVVPYGVFDEHPLVRPLLPGA